MAERVRIEVGFDSGQVMGALVAGESAEVAVRSEYFKVTAGTPVRVPLAHQGSYIEGPLPSKTADRRPDGTLITASVPQAVMLGR